MQDQRLNILIYPMLSVDNVNADSNYIIIKKLTHAILDQTDRYNFFLMMDKDRDFVNDLDPKVELLYVPMIRGKTHQVVSYPYKIFQKILKDLPIDIIWNNIVEQGHHLPRIFGGFEEDRQTKVLNFHHYIIHRSLNPTVYRYAENILWQQLAGSSLVNLNYFHTQYCYDMLMEEARDWLRPKKVQQIEERSHVELGGYCTHPPKVERYKKYSFIYNHRLDGYKDFETTFKLFDRLYREKYDFQVVITGGDSKNVNPFAEKPYAVVKSFKKHDEYLEEVARCHANVTNSFHETYCISIAESIVADHLVIAPNRVTFPELLGKDYPYLYRSVNDEYDFMKKAASERLEYASHVNKEKMYVESGAKVMIGLFETLAKGITPVIDRMKDQKKAGLLREWAKGHPSVTLQESMIKLYDLRYATQSMPPNKVAQLLRDLGYSYQPRVRRFTRREGHL